MKPEELELLILPKMMRAARALYADIVKFREGRFGTSSSPKTTAG